MRLSAMDFMAARVEGLAVRMNSKTSGPDFQWMPCPSKRKGLFFQNSENWEVAL